MNLDSEIQDDLKRDYVILPTLFIVCILSYQIPQSFGESDCPERPTPYGSINFDVIDFDGSAIRSIGYGHQCIFSDVIDSIKLDSNQVIVINFENPKPGNLEIFIPNDLFEEMKGEETSSEIKVWINGEQTEIYKTESIDERLVKGIVFHSPIGHQEILIGTDNDTFSNPGCSEISKHSLSNIRGQPVCISNESIVPLMQRGYLQDVSLSDEILDKLSLWSTVER